MERNSLELTAIYQKAKECYQQTEDEKHEEGFRLLAEAAPKGMTEAAKLLGILYMSGQYDPWPEKDEKQAAYWWRVAAENGDEEAMYWLGQCYEDGIGVEANEEEARIWKKFAISNGFVAEESEPEEEQPAEPENDAAPALKTVVRESKKEKKSRLEKKAEKADKKVNRPETKKRPAPQAAPVYSEATKSAHPVKEVTRKKEDEEAEAARFAREEEQARRISNQYRIRMGIGGAICCLLVLWILLLIVYWLIRETVQELQLPVGILAGLISLCVAIAGYSFGVRTAQRKTEMVAEYRKTPFYHGFGCELGQMTRQQVWAYQVYQALAKSFLPVTYRKKLDWPSLREYRGCLYPHWVYQSGKEKAQPEFVVLTEKAVYVIRTACYTGRIQGDLADVNWLLYSDGEKDLTAQKIPNLVDENAHNIRIIKEDLIQYSDLPLEQIPFYNVIFLNQQVDIKGLRRIGAADDTFFVHGSAEKLRGSMGFWESRLTMHNQGLENLVLAFEQVGRQFIKRSGW